MSEEKHIGLFWCSARQDFFKWSEYISYYKNNP